MPDILLLHDAHAAQGRADASDVLVEAAHVGAALESLGHTYDVLPVGLDLAALARRLAREPPYAVFNLVESLEGDGRLVGVVPALLEALGVPFTGASSAAQTSTSNKLLAKRRLTRADVPAPAAYDARAADTRAWIVKSVWEHASLGLDDAAVVTGAAAVADALARRTCAYGGHWFAEAYVEGRELNVGVIATDTGPRVLPAAEIVFEDFPPGKPKIVGYAAKWDGTSFESRHTLRAFVADAALAARAQALALRCWDLFELAGYARVDFRLDAAGKLSVLEVNTNPCLSPDAGFAAALDAAGVDLAQAVRWLVEDARRRALAAVDV